LHPRHDYNQSIKLNELHNLTAALKEILSTRVNTEMETTVFIWPLCRNPTLSKHQHSVKVLRKSKYGTSIGTSIGTATAAGFRFSELKSFCIVTIRTAQYYQQQ
jgi:hypothetical protein